MINVLPTFALCRFAFLYKAAVYLIHTTYQRCCVLISTGSIRSMTPVGLGICCNVTWFYGFSWRQRQGCRDAQGRARVIVPRVWPYEPPLSLCRTWWLRAWTVA